MEGDAGGVGPFGAADADSVAVALAVLLTVTVAVVEETVCGISEEEVPLPAPGGRPTDSGSAPKGRELSLPVGPGTPEAFVFPLDPREVGVLDPGRGRRGSLGSSMSPASAPGINGVPGRGAAPRGGIPGIVAPDGGDIPGIKGRSSSGSSISPGRGPRPPSPPERGGEEAPLTDGNPGGAPDAEGADLAPVCDSS